MPLRGGAAAQKEAASEKLTGGHLWQVDILRLLTFAAVICVHAIAYTEQPDNRAAGGIMMLLQFGRELFFALTAFVLVYSMTGRHLRLRRFWSRRLLYVLVPYVCWSAIYYGYSVLGPQHFAFSFTTFGTDLLDGGAMYHLYFLLVTMQLYVVFPALWAFLQRTRSRAGTVLAVVGGLNMAWFAVLQWVPEPSGTAGWFWQHAYELLPTYAVYVVAGGYAAMHLAWLQRMVAEHTRALLAVAAACAAGALAVYAVQLPFTDPRVADSVLQPGMLLSCVAAAIVLYIVGTRWASGPMRHQAKIAALSDASFGVYLAHPLVLVLLLDHGFGNTDQLLPAPLATVIAAVVAAAGGAAVALAARRTPLSLFLAGRPRRKPPAGPPTPVVDRAGYRTPALAPVRVAPARVLVSQQTSRSAWPASQRGGGGWQP